MGIANKWVAVKKENDKTTMEGIMKSLRNTIATVFTALLLSVLMIGCQQDDVSGIAGPSDISESPSGAALGKKNRTISSSAMTQMTYPQCDSTVIRYHSGWNDYRGGSINLLPSNSVFDLDGRALTPPAGMWGQDITITFTVDRDLFTNELIFTFGPHGAQFSPAARVILDYSDLGIDIPTLYYIDENGNYIQQQPADIDVTGKKLTIYVHHFSRYALARA